MSNSITAIIAFMKISLREQLGGSVNGEFDYCSSSDL